MLLLVATGDGSGGVFSLVEAKFCAVSGVSRNVGWQAVKNG